MPATAAVDAGSDTGSGAWPPPTGNHSVGGMAPLLRSADHHAGLRSNSSAKRSRCASDCTVRASVTQLL